MQLSKQKPKENLQTGVFMYGPIVFYKFRKRSLENAFFKHFNYYTCKKNDDFDEFLNVFFKLFSFVKFVFETCEYDIHCF